MLGAALRTIDLVRRDDAALISNSLGEYAILCRSDRDTWLDGEIGHQHPRYLDLLSRNLIDRPARGGRGLETAVSHTRRSFLLEGPQLHIFVVSLRCDHACQYCQVSRAGLEAAGFDMSFETADAAVDRVFEAPTQSLTVEFQGGEPALRFDLIERIVAKCEKRNITEKRDLSFSMVSTLHHLTAENLAFCRVHQIHLSTSIDGTAELHDRHRPNSTRDSWRRTVEALERARAVVGHQGVAAMPTITRAALAHPRDLIDTYRDLGFSSIFLRPISPYGFARKTKRAIGYDMPEFVAFYDAALNYILELNRQGHEVVETYASVMLRHIMTPFGSGYVDLRSPAGAGLGVLVYNYDGQVYPADEARMAAETGDRRFALGSVHDSFETLMASDAMRWLAAGSVAEQLPGCRDCAFVPFCGADPVYHAAAHGDPIGDRATSDFCAKNMGLFQILFGHIADADPEVMRTFQAWAFARPRSSLAGVGYVEQ